MAKLPGKQAAGGEKSLYQRIHAVYAELPAGERAVADLLLAESEDLAVFTASELADRAQVSNATVSRVFRRLGYRSYDEARQVSRRLRAAGSPLFTGSPASGTGPRRPIAEALAAETRVLEETMSCLNPLILKDIAGAIAGAERVRTLGFRNSAFVADYAAAALSQVRPRVSVLMAPGQTLADRIVQLDPGDVVIAVGLRRRVRGFNDAVMAMEERGARVVLIADSTVRELPAHASWTLDCVVNAPGLADSYVGAMALVRIIFHEVARVLEDRGRTYLREVEDLRDRLDELE